MIDSCKDFTGIYWLKFKLVITLVISKLMLHEKEEENMRGGEGETRRSARGSITTQVLCTTAISSLLLLFVVILIDIHAYIIQ